MEGFFSGDLMGVSCIGLHWAITLTSYLFQGDLFIVASRLTLKGIRTLFKLNPLVPELIVSDLPRSLAFYCGVLGFKIEYDRPEEHFAFLSFGGSQLMLEQDWQSESPWRVGPLEPPYGRGINLSIECADALSLVASLGVAGHSVRKPIEECWYRQGGMLVGQRNFLVQDPDGYLLRFAEDLGVKSA